MSKKIGFESRNNLLKDSHIIIYVCGSNAEFENLPNEKMKLGINIYQDEYNKIHFIEKYRSRCISIYLNRNNSKVKHNTKIRRNFSMVNTSEKDKRTQQLFLLRGNNENNHKFKTMMRLPAQNKDLLDSILSECHSNSTNKEFTGLVSRKFGMVNRVILSMIINRISIQLGKSLNFQNVPTADLCENLEIKGDFYTFLDKRVII